MEKKKFNPNGIVVILFELAVGVLLILNPDMFTRAIILAAGVVLAIVGIVNTISYFKTEAEIAAQGQKLVIGLGAMVLGVSCILGSKWIMDTLGALTLAYGVFLFLMGLEKVQSTVDMLRIKRGMWAFPLIGAVVSIVCAIIIIVNPFTAIDFVWTFIGVTLLIEAAFDIMTLVTKNKVKEEKPEKATSTENKDASEKTEETAKTE